MWMLLMLVVDTHDAYSVSTTIKVPFPTEIACEKASASLTYTAQREQFKVNSICKQES